MGIMGPHLNGKVYNLKQLYFFGRGGLVVSLSGALTAFWLHTAYPALISNLRSET